MRLGCGNALPVVPRGRKLCVDLAVTALELYPPFYIEVGPALDDVFAALPAFRRAGALHRILGCVPVYVLFLCYAVPPGEVGDRIALEELEIVCRYIERAAAAGRGMGHMERDAECAQALDEYIMIHPDAGLANPLAPFSDTGSGAPVTTAATVAIAGAVALTVAATFAIAFAIASAGRSTGGWIGDGVPDGAEEAV